MEDNHETRDCSQCRAEIAEEIHRLILMYGQLMPECVKDELKSLFVKLKFHESTNR